MAVEVLKAGDIMNGVYGIQQSFVKFSLLVLYYRLFWINDKFRIAVWAVGIAQGAWGLAVLLVHIFACNPIAKVWNPKIPGHCIDVNLFFNIYEPLNALLDFIVAGLAIWMLPALQMRRRTLVHLGFLFALGSFSGIISIIKVVQAQYAAQRNFQSVIWNIVQMATSIICCCAPIYQSILPKFGVYDKLYSWVSTVLSSRRSHGDSAGRHGPAANTSTGDNNRSKSGGLSQRSQWFNNYNGSSERALAWAEAGLKQNKGGSLGSKDTVNIPSGRRLWGIASKLLDHAECTISPKFKKRVKKMLEKAYLA
ncbi:hypothetical protein QQS21_011080 [Conoideocrella luteorostrata]|uniref:Rhodopsin domain-containing protein n=1 Tax=Conoideocrella luteorostrata TaxID=1105319 RepID=A0AAJ0FU30_9HYPO|nr:hypothetical protein QQS21_011080 [Conoideocrella luteorostrata]